jgi:hypothetical protein
MRRQMPRPKTLPNTTWNLPRTVLQLTLSSFVIVKEVEVIWGYLVLIFAIVHKTATFSQTYGEASNQPHFYLFGDR